MFLFVARKGTEGSIDEEFPHSTHSTHYVLDASSRQATGTFTKETPDFFIKNILLLQKPSQSGLHHDT